MKQQTLAASAVRLLSSFRALCHRDSCWGKVFLLKANAQVLHKYSAHYSGKFKLSSKSNGLVTLAQFSVGYSNDQKIVSQNHFVFCLPFQDSFKISGQCCSIFFVKVKLETSLSMFFEKRTLNVVVKLVSSLIVPFAIVIILIRTFTSSAVSTATFLDIAVSFVI